MTAIPSSPVALVVGAFGQDNPGDEALLDASVAAVRALGWTPLVVTSRPAETAARLRVDTVPATAVATAGAARRASALVVGGGTLFKELHPASGRSPGSLLRRATGLTGAFQARGRPVALIGVGADEIRHPTTRRLARSLARRADLLVLRDVASAALLSDMGVPAPLRVGADLAWLTLDPVGRALGAGAPSPIGVAISHLAGDRGLLDRLADGLRPLASRGHPIEIEPWQGSRRLGPDGRAAAHLARALGDGASVVQPPHDLTEAAARSATRGAVVALRFHAAVAAAAAGTPFVGVAHEPKLGALAVRLGQPQLAVDDPSAAVTAAVDRALLGDGPEPEAVAAERRRAEATVELLGVLLGGTGEAHRLVDLDLVPEPTPA
ncbi:MAG: polysaccharide pyruvyl transferase family protein [Acidimicrobiales bacterium]